MIRALLIYAVAVVTALVAVTVALGVPFEWVAWPVLAVEITVFATWGAARLARYMRRKARQTWTYTRPAPRLPVTRVTAEIITPTQTRQIEAPRREVEVHNVTYPKR